MVFLFVSRAVWRTAAAVGLAAFSRIGTSAVLEDRGSHWFGCCFSGRNESGLADRGGFWIARFFSDRNESGSRLAPVLVGRWASNPVLVGRWASNPVLVGRWASNPVLVGRSE